MVYLFLAVLYGVAALVWSGAAGVGFTDGLVGLAIAAVIVALCFAFAAGGYVYLFATA